MGIWTSRFQSEAVSEQKTLWHGTSKYHELHPYYITCICIYLLVLYDDTIDTYIYVYIDHITLHPYYASGYLSFDLRTWAVTDRPGSPVCPTGSTRIEPIGWFFLGFPSWATLIPTESWNITASTVNPSTLILDPNISKWYNLLIRASTKNNQQLFIDFETGCD